MAARPQPPVIRILFYAPGTGFGTTVPGVPFTIAHATFGDDERHRAMKSKGGFNIETAFTYRIVKLKDKRIIPGYIQLTDAGHVSNPKSQMVFNPMTGATAGHTYQRLIDFVSIAKKTNDNSNGKNGFLPIYAIYTVLDGPGSNKNLNFLFNAMRSAGYQDTFFDVCITASKGIRSLVPTIEQYKMDTTLVLINGGAMGYLGDRLSIGSKVRAVVLTHGAKDTPVVDKRFVRDFINGNKTKVFIYSNKQDGHNQASLILGDTNTLHPSIRKKTNRDFPYSYLPILVNAVYYVGRHRKNWAHLADLLKKDRRFVTVSDSLMVGGMGIEIGLMGGTLENGKSVRHCTKLYCGCDKNHTDIMYGGVGINGGSGIDINSDNLDSHLYPVTNDESFSDLIDSPIVIEQDIEGLGYPMVGGMGLMDGGTLENGKSSRQCTKLYCGCDKNHTDIMYGGVGINSGLRTDINTDINSDNLDNHLYPVTDDEPFSDLIDSPIVIEDFAQRGGYQGYPMVGHRMSEIIYNRNKTDYLYLDSIV